MARCWGTNSHGQLGNGTVGASSPEPVFVTVVRNAVALNIGSAHVTVLADGTARCWGVELQGGLAMAPSG